MKVKCAAARGPRLQSWDEDDLVVEDTVGDELPSSPGAELRSHVVSYDPSDATSQPRQSGGATIQEGDLQADDVDSPEAIINEALALLPDPQETILNEARALLLGTAAVQRGINGGGSGAASAVDRAVAGAPFGPTPRTRKGSLSPLEVTESPAHGGNLNRVQTGVGAGTRPVELISDLGDDDDLSPRTPGGGPLTLQRARELHVAAETPNRPSAGDGMGGRAKGTLGSKSRPAGGDSGSGLKKASAFGRVSPSRSYATLTEESGPQGGNATPPHQTQSSSKEFNSRAPATNKGVTPRSKQLLTAADVVSAMHTTHVGVTPPSIASKAGVPPRGPGADSASAGHTRHGGDTTDAGAIARRMLRAGSQVRQAKSRSQSPGARTLDAEMVGGGNRAGSGRLTGTGAMSGAVGAAGPVGTSRLTNGESNLQLAQMAAISSGRQPRMSVERLNMESFSVSMSTTSGVTPGVSGLDSSKTNAASSLDPIDRRESSANRRAQLGRGSADPMDSLAEFQRDIAPRFSSSASASPNHPTAATPAPRHSNSASASPYHSIAAAATSVEGSLRVSPAHSTVERGFNVSSPPTSVSARAGYGVGGVGKKSSGAGEMATGSPSVGDPSSGLDRKATVAGDDAHSAGSSADENVPANNSPARLVVSSEEKHNTQPRYMQSTATRKTMDVGKGEFRVRRTFSGPLSRTGLDEEFREAAAAAVAVAKRESDGKEETLAGLRKSMKDAQLRASRGNGKGVEVAPGHHDRTVRKSGNGEVGGSVLKERREFGEPPGREPGDGDMRQKTVITPVSTVPAPTKTSITLAAPAPTSTSQTPTFSRWEATEEKRADATGSGRPQSGGAGAAAPLKRLQSKKKKPPAVSIGAGQYGVQDQGGAGDGGDGRVQVKGVDKVVEQRQQPPRPSSSTVHPAPDSPATSASPVQPAATNPASAGHGLNPPGGSRPSERTPTTATPVSVSGTRVSSGKTRAAPESASAAAARMTSARAAAAGGGAGKPGSAGESTRSSFSSQLGRHTRPGSASGSRPGSASSSRPGSASSGIGGVAASSAKPKPTVGAGYREPVGGISKSAAGMAGSRPDSAGVRKGAGSTSSSGEPPKKESIRKRLLSGRSGAARSSQSALAVSAVGVGGTAVRPRSASVAPSGGGAGSDHPVPSTTPLKLKKGVDVLESSGPESGGEEEKVSARISKAESARNRLRRHHRRSTSMGDGSELAAGAVPDHAASDVVVTASVTGSAVGTSVTASSAVSSAAAKLARLGSVTGVTRPRSSMPSFPTAKSKHTVASHAQHAAENSDARGASEVPAVPGLDEAELVLRMGTLASAGQLSKARASVARMTELLDAVLATSRRLGCEPQNVYGHLLMRIGQPTDAVSAAVPLEQTLGPEKVRQMIATTTELRSNLRIKVQDNNDLRLAATALRETTGFFERLDGAAGKAGMDPHSLLAAQRGGPANGW